MTITMQVTREMFHQEFLDSRHAETFTIIQRYWRGRMSGINSVIFEGFVTRDRGHVENNGVIVKIYGDLISPYQAGQYVRVVGRLHGDPSDLFSEVGILAELAEARRQIK